jgi:homoserine O-acetyltransferase
MLRTLLLGLAFLALVLRESRAQGDLQYAELGQCALESGEVLEDCRVAYRTFGELSADKTNAVLFPTQFMGTSATIAEYIGPEGLVNDAEHFVIAVDAFANGISTSPSNSGSQPGDLFPHVSIRDMVASQHRLVTEILGLSSLRGVIGISMGGMQAFEWAVSYPGFAEKIVPIASSPRLASYDIVLWETVLRILSVYQKCQCQEAVSALMGIGFLTGNSPDYHARVSPRDSVPGIISRMDNQVFAVPIAQNLAVQIRAMIRHNVAAPYDDSLEQTATRIRADVLIIVTPKDHVVTPAPALDFAEVLGAEAIQLSNDCGHNGLRCDSQMLSQATQRFLAKRY